MTPLSSIEAGRPVEGVYAVRRSRGGRPFLALALSDSTAAVRAVVLDEPEGSANPDP